MTVSNTGGSDLRVEASVRYVPATGAAHPSAPAWPPGAPIPLTPDPATRTPASGSGTERVTAGHAVLTGSDILVLATSEVSRSVLRSLDELGEHYDLIYTDDFSSVSFAGYATVIVAMDGGYVEAADVQALAAAASSGANLVMLGGTSFATYYDGVGSYLLAHTGMMGWDTSATPHLRIVDASDPLAAGLPATHSFFDRKQAEFANESADAWKRVQAFIAKYKGKR